MMTTYAQQANSGSKDSPAGGGNSNSNSGGGGGSNDSKKEEYRKYLERTGVLSALTQVMVGLYEEPERPADAIGYIKRHLGAPQSVDIEGIKRENDQLRTEKGMGSKSKGGNNA